MRKLASYDLEIFPDDAFIVVKDMKKNIIYKEHTKTTFNADKLAEIVTGHTLVHFNGYGYDDFILSAMLSGANTFKLKQLNDDIIVKKKKRPCLVDERIDSLDCYQQLGNGLKKLEAFMGKSIIESKIDFNKRNLTPDEIAETFVYCEYDVDCTIDVYFYREDSYFKPKAMLLERCPESWKDRAKRWNTTTISANYLMWDEDKKKALPLRRWSDIRLKSFDESEKPLPASRLTEYDMFKYVPEDVRNYWLSTSTGSYSMNVFGLKIEFSKGGIHGVPSKNQHDFKNVIFLDVASLYPNIIRILRALGDKTDAFWQLVLERLEAKHAKKGVLANALKLIINSVYGLLKNKHSILFNPKASLSVCIFGQIALYNLCERLYNAGCTLVNLNTDGIGFQTNPDDPDCWKTIWHEWEKEFDLELEDDHFSRLYQKDVNNYVGFHESGEMKAKGGDLKKFDGEFNFSNVSLGIVDRCLMEWVKNKKSPRKTIMENLDKPILFQQILQAGPTFDGTVEIDQDGNPDMAQKVNRVFACDESHPDRTVLKKLRADGVGVKFADSPDNMIIYNDSLENLTEDELASMIDLKYYYDLSMKVIERWRT